MKFYLSYWSGGYQNIPNENVINMHKLSAYLIKKHYGECHLITDMISKPHFQSIPFTTITTELESLGDTLSFNWALGKLYVYNILSKRGESFLHIDYDVFLWNPLPVNFLNKSVITQSIESKIYKKYYLSLIKHKCKNKYLLNDIKENDDAYNMGIFGGNDLDFIEKYSKSAIEFSLDRENQNIFEEVHAHTTSAVAVVCEQYYLKRASEYYSIPITTLFGDTLPKEDKDKIANKIGYTHVVGAKMDPNILKRIEKRILEFNL